MKEGAYVICTDDSNWDPRAHVKMSSLPKKNQIYQIRRLIYGFSEKTDEPGIALVGIFGDWEIFVNNYSQTVFEEYHFNIRRFREIDSDELYLVLEQAELEALEIYA
jgi:hypothetical protein